MLRARFLHLIICIPAGPGIEPRRDRTLTGGVPSRRANHYTTAHLFEVSTNRSELHENVSDTVPTNLLELCDSSSRPGLHSQTLRQSTRN